jgi:hypothetical protein
MVTMPLYFKRMTATDMSSCRWLARNMSLLRPLWLVKTERQKGRTLLYEERRKRDAQRIGDVVNQLMARRGYGQIVGSEQIRTVWKDIAGPLGTHSVPGNLRRGVLEVFVRNSAVMQELTFRKRQLLIDLAKVFDHQTIDDLRFRVGTID